MNASSEFIEHNGCTIQLTRDEGAENPRNASCNVGAMVCFHGGYNLGDDHDLRRNDYSDWDEMREALEEDHGPFVILPLYLHDHSGITMRTNPFDCKYDSGQVGFIYCSEARALEYLETCDPDKIAAALIAEVAEYDQYLTGDVWYYEVKDYSGEAVGGCGNIYGYEAAIAEAKAEADAHMKHRVLETLQV